MPSRVQVHGFHVRDGNFFARMVGINFAIMTLGYAELGAATLDQATMLFHVA